MSASSIVKFIDDSAALICVNYAGGGEIDWFLPSRDELTEMYINLRLENIGDFSTDVYWSSSEGFSNTLAWARSFSDGQEYGRMKGDSESVRDIRAF